MEQISIGSVLMVLIYWGGGDLNTINKSASCIGRSKEFGIAVNVEEY